MAFSTNMVVLVVATGILAVAWWRSRREKFETPEERKQRKIREAEAKFDRAWSEIGFGASGKISRAAEELAARMGSQPDGYAERLKRKLGLAPPRNLQAEISAGRDQLKWTGGIF